MDEVGRKKWGATTTYLFIYTGFVACLLKLLLDPGVHHEVGFASVR